MELNDEQLVTLESGIKFKCILASAGSGKTNTIIHHIANDLKNGIKPDQILAFTFTIKAAEDLLNRVLRHCKEHLPNLNIEELYIGTIHSWCFSYLSEQENFLNFSTLDVLHEFSLISRLYNELKLDNIYSAKYPLGIIKFQKDLEVYYNEDIDEEDVPYIVKNAIIEYENLLIENRLMNFGSMVKNTIKCLNENGGLENLKKLYVDEYQDVNRSQVSLIKSMLSCNTELTVVGDDLQSIYNWRGSDVSRILSFIYDFPGSKTYILNYNFRSLPELVELSNTFSLSIINRYIGKSMISQRKSKAGKKIYYRSLINEIEQAQEIVNLILEFTKNGYEYKDIAILLRSTKSSGKVIIQSLTSRGIPVESPLTDRVTNFIFLFIIPVLKWLSDEQRDPRDEAEEQEQERKANELYAAYLSFGFDSVNESVFWNSIGIWRKEIDDKSNDSYNIRKNLYSLFFSLKIKVDNNDSNLLVALGILSQIIRSVEEIHRRRLKGRDKKKVVEVYRELYNAIEHNYGDFGESYPVNQSSKGILVTTVHQSKGLEWPIVILPMLNPNKFPTKLMRSFSSFSDAINDRYSTGLEDEKRLFYVALTRAKDKLALFDTANKKGKVPSKFLSVLLEENDDDILKVLKSNSVYLKKEIDNGEDGRKEQSKIGLSDVLIYISCPFQYGLRRKVEIQPSIADELGYGKSLHEIIHRRFLKKKSFTDAELSKLVTDYVLLPYQLEAIEKESRKSIKESILVLEKLGLFDFNISPEEKIEIILEDGIVEGIVDAIIENADGTISIIDWKSNIHAEYIDTYIYQTQFYAFALQSQGYVIKDILLIDIGASQETGVLKIHNVEVDNDSLSKFGGILNKALKGILIEDYSALPSKKTCSSCDMKKLCKHYKI